MNRFFEVAARELPDTRFLLNDFQNPSFSNSLMTPFYPAGSFGVRGFSTIDLHGNFAGVAAPDSLQALLQPIEHVRYVMRPVIVTAVNDPPGLGIVVNF